MTVVPDEATVSAVTGFDHLVILVRDIDAAARQYAALGFQLTARGHHTRGTCNHTMMLDGNYIELVTVEHPNAGNAEYTDRLAKYEGAQAIGLATNDARAVHRELQALPYEIAPFLEFSREVMLPDGVRQASFRAARFPALPDLPDMFCCEHLTRDVVWRPEWQEHANGAVAVTGVVVVHSAPDRAAKAWKALFGAPGLGKVHVDFVTREAIAQRLGGMAFAPEREDGFIAGVSIAMRSVPATAELLANAGIETFRTAEGSVAPLVQHTCGTMLEFRAMP